MIKKFYQFINEEIDTDIVAGLNREDVEDQFLRISEVYECKIVIKTIIGGSDKKKWVILIFPNHSKDDRTTEDKLKKMKTIEQLKGIEEELNRIKIRIESMYDDVVVVFPNDKELFSWGDFYQSLTVKPSSFYIYIKSKPNK